MSYRHRYFDKQAEETSKKLRQLLFSSWKTRSVAANFRKHHMRDRANELEKEADALWQEWNLAQNKEVLRIDLILKNE